MRIAFFEDAGVSAFGPLVDLRPVFDLVCGHRSVRERILSWLRPPEWGAFVRDRLAELVSEQHPDARVNDADWLAAGPTLLLNGRWWPDAESLRAIEPDAVGVVDGTLAYLVLRPEEAAAFGNGLLERLARSRRMLEAGGSLMRHPWELVDANPRWIETDFAAAKKRPLRDDVTVVGPRERLQVADGADVDPFVVFDVRTGPITVADGALVHAFTRIEGPAYVGPGAKLFRAQVRGGVTIGPHCRVGGEVEASILHGYANKYHDGFLGHSYVCPWVNLGALTTNSDLKNDYSDVSVPIGGERVASGSSKVGCFVGDHAKTALGTLFNTGSAVGTMSMSLPSGRLMPKHLPSFTRYWNGELVAEPDLDAAIDVARIVMSRRNCELTPAGERAMRSAFEATRSEREVAIRRFRERSSTFGTTTLSRVG